MTAIGDKSYDQLIEDVFKRLKPYIDDIVRAHVREIMPLFLDEVIKKQRKDIGDELVRILLEKAFTSVKESRASQD